MPWYTSGGSGEESGGSGRWLKSRGLGVRNGWLLVAAHGAAPHAGMGLLEYSAASRSLMARRIGKEVLSMDIPGAASLLETVRQMNEMARRARSGEPSVEDYLRMVSSDPVTEWFTGLLREKNEELEQERQRGDRLARALRACGRADE